MTPEDRAAVLLITEDVGGIRGAPGVPEITCTWCECVIDKGQPFIVERELPDSPFSHLHDQQCRNAVDEFNRYVKYTDRPDGLKQYPMPGKREWTRSHIKALTRVSDKGEVNAFASAAERARQLMKARDE